MENLLGKIVILNGGDISPVLGKLFLKFTAAGITRILLSVGSAVLGCCVTFKEKTSKTGERIHRFGELISAGDSGSLHLRRKLT